jgi:hypothetical protein
VRKARCKWGGLITVRRASNRSTIAHRRGGEVCRGFEGLKEGVRGYGFQVNGSYGVLDVDLRSKESEGKGFRKGLYSRL